MKCRLYNLFAMAVTAIVALGLIGCTVIGPTRTVINTEDAPAAIGPYSQAIQFGNLLFLAGQISIDPRTSQFRSGSIEEQTALILENLEAVLAANGMTLKDVVSTSVFLTDLNDFDRMNEVYGNYFKEKPPARETLQVERLPRDALIEISAIAAK